MSPPPEPWIALYSLHYHGEWGQYGLTGPDAMPAEFIPRVPQEAVDRLIGYAGPRANRYRRLAIAALCRGRDSGTLQHPPADASALVDKLAHAELLGPDIPNLHTILGYSDRGTRFSKALALVMPAACGLSDFTTNATFCQPARLSDVKVAATIAVRPQVLANRIDPRLWHTNFPELWETSDTVGALTDFVDRDNDPVLIAAGPPDRWTSNFFEKLGWVTGGSTVQLKLGTIRNVLAADFSLVDEGVGGARFTYRVAECLSTDYVFQGARNQGGIDHDSGLVSVAPDPSDPSKSLVTAQKTLRFTQPKGALLAMNEAAFIDTLLLLEWLVIAAACSSA